MPDLKTMPDEKRIGDGIAYHKRLWLATHTEQWPTYDEFYQGEFKVWNADGRSPNLDDREFYRRARARSIVEHGVDSQLTYMPKVHRRAIGNADDAQDRADRLTEGLQAVIMDSLLREMSLPPRLSAKYLTHLGYFVLKAPILDGRCMQERIDSRKKEKNETAEEFEWRQRESKAAVWNPVRIEVPHPASVLMDPSERDPAEAVEIEVMPGYRVMEISQEKMKSRKNAVEYRFATKQDPSLPVMVEHLWSRYWHAFRAYTGAGDQEPQLVYVEMNKSRMLPFLHTLAGFGMEPTNGTGDPKHVAVGILHGVLDSLRTLAQNDSSKHFLNMRRAYAQVTTEGNPAELRDQMRGGVVHAAKDEIGIMPTPALDARMTEHGHELLDDIEDGTYSRSLGGIRIPGVSTASEAALQHTSASRRFVEPVTQLTHIYSELARRILKLVDTAPTLEDGIGARGKIVQRSDIQHNYDVEVTFEDIDPVVKLREKESDQREVSLRLMGRETYIERHSRNTVTEEMDRLAEDVVMELVGPELATAAADRMGLRPEFEAAKKRIAEQVAADGRTQGDNGVGPARRSSEQLRDMPAGLTPDIPTPPREG